MEVKIIDDALPIQTFELVKRNLFFNPKLNLYVQGEVSGHGIDDKNSLDNWCLYHSFYNEGKPNNDEFYDLLNIFGKFLTFKLNGKTYSHKAILRIKLNHFPRTQTLYKHPYHSDTPFDHHSGIYCLNTCDGYTEFEDGTKINSIGNRFYIFNGSVKHRSTTTTNAKGRVNLNFNWL